jgi:hypothetical protein
MGSIAKKINYNSLSQKVAKYYLLFKNKHKKRDAKRHLFLKLKSII